MYSGVEIMGRLYVGIRTVGKPEQILERITRIIRKLKLTKTVPIIKLERKPRGEFYVFLAVDGVKSGSLPREVSIALETVGLSKYIWPIDGEEVKNMVLKSDIETHTLNALMYRPLMIPAIDNPLDLFISGSDNSGNGEQDQSDRYDKLLYWLSFTLEGSWENFVRTCEILNLTNDFNRPQSILRKMTVLGHIKCSDDGTKWSVCPPIFVRKPIQNTWFICGQRSPKLIKELFRFHIDVILQPNSQGPSCILIKNVSENELLHFSSNVLSEQVVNILPTLSEWKENLAVVEKINTSTFDLSRWNGNGYSKCSEFYEKDGKYFGSTGLYRLTRKLRDSQSYSLILYFDNNDQKWYKGDWYGLRFLANRAIICDDCEVFYDSFNKTILIPQAERWPLIFERTLVLASGLLPSKLQNGWLIYKDISLEMLKEFENKLNFLAKEGSKECMIY